MLKRIRIEVEESTAGEASSWLDTYEQVAARREAGRWGLEFESYRDLDELLGREVTEEVIEFDPTIPGYKGRRVVRYTRIDTRPSVDYVLKSGDSFAESVKMSFSPGEIRAMEDKKIHYIGGPFNDEERFDAVTRWVSADTPGWVGVYERFTPQVGPDEYVWLERWNVEDRKGPDDI